MDVSAVRLYVVDCKLNWREEIWKRWWQTEGMHWKLTEGRRGGGGGCGRRAAVDLGREERKRGRT